MPKKAVNKYQLKIDQKAVVQKKRPQKKHKRRGISFRDDKPPKGWMVAGFDVSMSSIAGAAIAYDGILKKFKGPVFTEIRWTKDDHYFTRLGAAARSHDLVLDLQGQMLLSLSLENIFIAQEEPWPFGLVRGSKSAWLKQQAEISGAFLGGLVRYGFQNVSQMNSIRWRTMVADELEITTHHSKWKDPKLVKTFNCKPGDTGKFRSKQWAMNPGYGFQGLYDEIPDWPDIIESTKLGKIPRPEDSKAKAVQSDDRYDALAVMWTHRLELEESGLLDV